MGADGGIRITKMKNLKHGWPAFRSRLIVECNDFLFDSDEFDEKIAQECFDCVADLPLSVEHLSYVDIVSLLQFAKNCDCPKMVDGYLITGEGDAIPRSMNILSTSLAAVNGIYIETWT